MGLAMEKREQLITTAFSLFYQEGVHAVGINRILKQSGVAKKTLYHHFPAKDDLIIAVLEFRHEQYCRWLEKRLTAVSPGAAGVDVVFTALDDWINSRDGTLSSFHGCFFINVSAEFGHHEHPAHRCCAEHKSWMLEVIKEQIAAMGIRGKKRVEVSESLAMLAEGAIVQAHVRGQNDAARRAGQAARLLLAHYQ